jgi:hypothetical protein
MHKGACMKVRLLPDEKEAFEQAARLAGVPLSAGPGSGCCERQCASKRARHTGSFLNHEARLRYGGED